MIAIADILLGIFQKYSEQVHLRYLSYLFHSSWTEDILVQFFFPFCTIRVRFTVFLWYKIKLISMFGCGWSIQIDIHVVQVGTDVVRTP